MLRTGRMLTLHPLEGRAKQRNGSNGERVERQLLREGAGSRCNHGGCIRNPPATGDFNEADSRNFDDHWLPPKSRVQKRKFRNAIHKNELSVLSRAAAKDGMKVREWAREALLREARRSEDPLFTELIATRMILLNLLKPLAMGQVVTPEDFTRISATVRSDKRKVAQEIQQQYITASPKEF